MVVCLKAWPQANTAIGKLLESLRGRVWWKKYMTRPGHEIISSLPTIFSVYTECWYIQHLFLPSFMSLLHHVNSSYLSPAILSFGQNFLFIWYQLHYPFCIQIFLCCNLMFFAVTFSRRLESFQRIAIIFAL